MLSEKLFAPLKGIDLEPVREEVPIIDDYNKKLKFFPHLNLLVYGVVNDIMTLTELAQSSESPTVKNMIGFSISKSELSKVHRKRDFAVFVYILFELIYSHTYYHRFWKLRKKLQIIGIDSTFLNIKSGFSAYGYSGLTGKLEDGIKVHMAALLENVKLPLTAVVTPGNVNDSPVFEEILSDIHIFLDLEDCILTFDKAYNKLKRFKELTNSGIRFVARMKKNWKYEVLYEKIHGDFKDQAIKLSNGLVLRHVIYKEGTDDKEDYITNIWDMEAEAYEIRLIYKARWGIEILFRELKSYLKFDHFFSKDLNGILIQIFTTLVAYILIQVYAMKYYPFSSILAVKRELKHFAHGEEWRKSTHGETSITFI